MSHEQTLDRLRLAKSKLQDAKFIIAEFGDRVMEFGRDRELISARIARLEGEIAQLEAARTAAEILAEMGLLEEAALAEAEVIALDVLNRATDSPPDPLTDAEREEIGRAIRRIRDVSDPAPTPIPRARLMSFRGAARLLRDALGQDPAFRQAEGGPALEGRYLREG